jgi:hypothetical protein
MRRRATTLVEVIAALVVLGTVLASVIVARGRFLRQRAAADRQLRAVEAADRLVDGWTAGGTSFDAVPRFGSGPLPEGEGYRWRTSERPNPGAAALSSHVIRVEVWGPAEAEAQRWQPIVSLDLLVHDRTARPAADAGGRGAP